MSCSHCCSASIQCNGPDDVFDFLLMVALDSWVRAELERRGFTPDERRRGHELAIDAATATLEPRNHGFDDLEAAEEEIEIWLALGLRRCERVIARDYPDQYLLLTQDLEPAEGIRAVPAAKFFIRRFRTLRGSSGPVTPAMLQRAGALTVLERRHFTPREIRRVERYIESVEVAASIYGSPAAEMHVLEQWYAHWMEITLSLPPPAETDTHPATAPRFEALATLRCSGGGAASAGA